MDRLKGKNIPVYRTDEAGTIVMTSDGNAITFNVKQGSYNYNDNPKSTSSNTTSTNKYYSDNSSAKLSSNTTSNIANKTTPTQSASIKGNINSSGEKIYHVPGGAYYDRTDAEMWFNTEAEAENAGFRKSKR
jgi:competence protein ComEC